MSAARATGAGAVMADRARGEVEADTPEQKLFRALEFFPTPPWAARAGAELITRLDPGSWSAWEPACGQGHMAEAVRPYFSRVLATDIHPHGWSGQDAVADFLDPALIAVGPPVDWIVTNPPFGLAADFVRVGLKRAARGVAILQRLQWEGSGDRHDLFHGADPLTIKATFYERPAHHLGVWKPKGSTATDYAWFLWLKPPALVAAAQRHAGVTAASGYLGLAIPPGTRDRLTRPDDARLWGEKAAAPLFEGFGDE